MNAEARRAAPLPGPFDALLFCARHLRSLVLVTALGTAVAVGVALLWPPWYSAEVRLLPAQIKGSRRLNSLPASQLLPLQILGLALDEDSGLVEGLLLSRGVADAMIQRFGLREVYGARDRDSARLQLMKRVHVTADRRTGLVSMVVRDRSPARARDLANAIADEVVHAQVRIDREHAGRLRRFLETRLATARKELERADAAYRDFQLKHRVLDVGQQIRQAVSEVAQLRAELTAREVQLEYVQSYAAAGEQEAALLRREVARIKKEIEARESAPVEGLDDPASLGASLRGLPHLTAEYLRRLRDRRIHEATVQALNSEYQAARLEEHSEAWGAQLIDRAVTPTRRAGPKRAMIVLIGLVLAFGAAVIVARWRDALAHDPETRRGMAELRHLLRRRGEP